MGLFDLLSLIFDNLGRRKARVALTAVGVIIGTAAVVVLVSLAIGLQQSATQQLYGIGDLTQIQVYPNYGESGPIVMRAEGSSGSGDQTPTQTTITDNSLAELAGLPGVVVVIPRDYYYDAAFMYYGRLETYASLQGLGTSDLSTLGLSAQSGTLELNRGTVVIGAMVPRNFYDPRIRPGQEPPAEPELLDQQIKLTLMKWTEDGQEIRKSYQLRVAGIIAESRGESDWSVYVPLEELTVFNEWRMGRRINRQRDGYSNVIVKVADVNQVLDITEQITTMGYMAHTPQTFVQGINSFFLILQVIFGGVGAIALLVAAIGIANTMAMAILERTREIGLMKALGATNRDVLTVFLGEAAGIGLIGGIGGVVMGWGFGQIINVLAMVYLAGQAAQQGGPPPIAAVITPVWLPIFALVFATLIGLVSGLFPALRAANMVPVAALKYE